LKAIVIYFSQTGNTEKIAEAIATGITQVTGWCDTAEIREISPLDLKEYDLIGLGSPVMGAAPTNVIDFADKMRFVGGKHVFAFCTHGTNPGFYLPSIHPTFTKRGLKVIGFADWYGDCSLLHMPQPYPTAGHPDETDLQEAEVFGREMALRSAKISAGATDLIPPAPTPPPPPKLKVDGNKSMADIINSFSELVTFDKEKCLYPSCTLCMDNCPTFGNDLSVDPPVFGEPCLGCEFCARVCPTGAIDMSAWVAEMAGASSKHFPMMLSQLDKAEAAGHFRRLIPVEEIDINTVGAELYTSHPQWIIGRGAQQS
jgi:flavodoxin/ferredoxin